MHYLDIAVPVALHQTFSYSAELPLLPGVRVKVSFGARKLVGVVLSSSTEAPKTNHTIKGIEEVLDLDPVYSDALLQLGRWLSSYYLYPIGEVLRAMLPLSVVKKEKTTYQLTDAGLTARSDDDHTYSALLKHLWKQKRPLNQTMLKKKLTAWVDGRDEFKKLSLKKLEKDGLIASEKIDRTQSRSFWSEDGAREIGQASIAPELTPLQRAVFDALAAHGFTSQKNRQPHLLHGVTGAGKTEIYLHLIEAALKEDATRQSLVLVPEIALTPQMTRVFSARFPGQVAVVHSAMLDKDRWQELQLVRGNQRQILIGPRSAVFAAFANLGLIIVDEEHDTSYKQTTGLTYNGRDVAVMRGHIEGLPVILGSATPSMESYANAVQGKYQLHEILERANRRPMPAIEFIRPDASKGFARKMTNQKRETPVIELPVDERILEALRANHQAGKQAMVLVNRRGYAYYLFSLRERKAVTCPNCSISLTVHERSTILRCHYCDFQKPVAKMIPSGDEEGFVLVGYGSEQMEHFLKEGVPGAKIQRVDSDSMQQRDRLPQILGDFREGNIDILVGTQMLAKGHDFAKVTLICILEIDQTLNLPDFRAGERTFQLMVQAAGRAGRGEWSGEVMIQTQKPDHPVLQAGLHQSYAEFWSDQLQFRRAHAYPPFARMIVFEFSASKRDKLTRWTQGVEAWIMQKLKAPESPYKRVSVLGPSVPPLETIRGRSRRTLLLMAQDRGPLWALAREIQATFTPPFGDLRLRVDVDPQSLM